jgi:hypothetical protein
VVEGGFLKHSCFKSKKTQTLSLPIKMIKKYLLGKSGCFKTKSVIRLVHAKEITVWIFQSLRTIYMSVRQAKDDFTYSQAAYQHSSM